MVSNPQLSPRVVGSQPDSNRRPFARKTGVLTSRPQRIDDNKGYFVTITKLSTLKINILNYRIRAINHSSFYSNITIFALKLAHKK